MKWKSRTVGKGFQNRSSRTVLFKSIQSKPISNWSKSTLRPWKMTQTTNWWERSWIISITYWISWTSYVDTLTTGLESFQHHGPESIRVIQSRTRYQSRIQRLRQSWKKILKKGGLKTKTNVPIPDESNDWMSLGEVVYVMKAGVGSRVIVNHGTDEKPYCDIYPGAELGKGVAEECVKGGIYGYEKLPKVSLMSCWNYRVCESNGGAITLTVWMKQPSIRLAIYVPPYLSIAFIAFHRNWRT